MSYTQEQLEAMSDYEINRLVADNENVDYDIFHHIDAECTIHDVNDQSEINYCNNPAQIMPIALGSRIGSAWSYFEGISDYWKAKGSTQRKPGPFVRFESISKDDPYRAICIVYLLMQGDE
ncbi:DUF2591 family protein [Aliikangiella coralliicola]|nr:DUF2591 family protein [Aliikangiella coralliicola]